MTRSVLIRVALSLLWGLTWCACAADMVPAGAPGDALVSVPVPAAHARVVAVTPNLRLNHFIHVQVENLQGWTRGGTASPWKLVPYINQRALAGLYPVAVDTGTGTLQYRLHANSANAETWNHLLSPLAFERAVRFSVGLEHQDALPTTFDQAGRRVRLIVIDRWWSAVSLALLLVLAFAFARLATRTTMLMDVGVNADGTPTMRYSLAKVQFAVWFFVILSAFLVIWLTTDNFNSLNTSIVAVLGISAGTAVSDSLLKRGELGAVQAADIPASRWRHGRAFLNDLVCDAQGHSITRFQMLAWTVVLIVVFLVDVVHDLVMPMMGPELLYLLGLSSGAYVARRRTDAPVFPPGGIPTAAPAPPTGPLTRFGD